MNISFAPLQGYTDAAYRRFHRKIYGDCIDFYYTPFLRLENGEPRQRDLRDIKPDNNTGLKLIPQLICRDATEFDTLAGHIVGFGYSHIDINMGCPFPLQTKKHRGSGLLTHPDTIKEILDCTHKYPDITFSIKMRLGYDKPQQCLDLLPIINQARLTHITMHPRVGTQQYRGNLDIVTFNRFYEQCQHPIIFNGDITTIEQISQIVDRYPGLKGIMIGRGLLARPSLAMEYKNGQTLTDQEQIKHIVDLHSLLFTHYATTLQGDTQLLSKIKPFWEYLEPLIGHKIHKNIKKATTLPRYTATVQAL